MKMTQREKLLVLLLLACVLLYLDYTYLIKNQLESLEMSKNDLATYEQKLQELSRAPELIKSYDVKMVDLTDQAYSILDKQFTTTQQEEVILLLTDLSEGTGLSLMAVNFDIPFQVIEEDKTLYQVPIIIDYEGTYEALTIFLKKVWGFQKDIVVQELDMSLDTGEMLTGSLTLNLYYMMPPKGMSYEDKLYQFLIDDTFFKGNPFKISSGSSAFRINYVFTGGKELVVEAYTPFTDIKGHWAEKEINAFGEQGFIKKGQSGVFEPDVAMTRGEFIIMIDSIYQWPTPTAPADLSQYSDYDNLGSYENAISKAVVKGLLGGYVVGFDDNTLRPRDPITYSDVEFIMKRIKDDPAFTWDVVAAKLLEDKGITSVGVLDKGAQMTKAEAVYLMTYFR